MKAYWRAETRQERYKLKRKLAQTLPVSIATINFICDENLGYLIRATACFGARRIICVGSIPERKHLMPSSGSLVDYVDIVQFHTPHELIEYSRDIKANLMSAEICNNSISIFKHKFDFERETIIVIGNEEIGVPEEILHNSKSIFIPMTGVGYCLNASQTANIMLYEYAKQFNNITED